jgi:hypothetical protein
VPFWPAPGIKKPANQQLFSAKDLPQFVLGVFQDSLLPLRQIFPGTIYVKVQRGFCTRQNVRTRGKSDFYERS